MAPFNWKYERTNPRKKSHEWYIHRDRMPTYRPYSYHSKSTEIWIPNISQYNRLPMKLIVMIKRAYFAASTNPQVPKIMPSIIQAMMFGLTTSGDLLHKTRDKISIFTTPSDKHLLWRCEACNFTSFVNCCYDTRCPDTNSILYSTLQNAFDDPRSNVHKHLNSDEHTYHLKIYRKKEMDYWHKFISTSIPDFFARIFMI